MVGLRRIGTGALLLSIVAGLAFTSVSPAQSQQEGSAPRIISSNPAQREVVGPDSTIQITFDQPMNRASVEASFSMDPKVDGAVSWTDDSTFNFKSAGPLKRGQEYTIKLSTGAKSAAGTALDDPWSLTFQVKANLSVNQVIPAPNSQNIEAGATITVIFDRPVVPLVTTGEQKGLPQPLTFNPAVDGKGEWVGTAIYTFRPSKALAGGTKYTVSVAGELKDVDGTPMSGGYSWDFSTLPPQILGYSPSDGSYQVPLDGDIVIQFNQPMDRTSTQSAFAVRNTVSGANVAGSLIWENDDRQLRFKPAARYELATRYQVSILGSAKSATGQAALTNPTTFNFISVPYPAVVGTQPQAGEKVSPGGGASVTFSTYMDEKSFINRVHVDPKPENLSINPSGMYLGISFQSQAETTYTITLDAGIADIYGNMLKDPYKFSFSTGSLPPALGIGKRDEILVTSAYRPNTTVLTSSINVSQLEARLGALEPSELFARAQEYGNLNLYQYNPPRISREWVEKPDVPRNKRADVAIKLKENGGQLAPGLYYFELAAPELREIARQNNQIYEPMRQVIVVSTVSITAKIAPDGALLVWVTDLKSGQPAANVTVDIKSYNGQALTTVKTDANGLAQAKVPVDTQRYYYGYWVMASGDGVFGLSNLAWSNIDRGDESITYDSQPVHPNVYLYTDQPVYRPGHPVLFRGLVRYQNDVTFSIPQNLNLEMAITNPQGQEILKKPVTLNAYGGFNGKYEIPADAPLGQYYISLRLPNATNYDPTTYVNGSVPFQIAEFRPPEFLVNATSEAAQVAAGDTIKVTFDAQFLFGGAVSGGAVNWTAIANSGSFSYLGEGSYDFGNQRNWVYNRPVTSGSGKLDDKGKLTVDVPADLGGINSTQTFTIEASVTDVSNQVIAGRTTVTVHPATVYVGVQPTKYVGKAGEPLDVKLIAVDWASQPKAAQKLTVNVVELRWEQDQSTLNWSQKSIPVTNAEITTDAKGQGLFTLTPPRAGIYQVDVTTRDPRERIAQTTLNLWVSGPNSVSWGNESKAVRMVLDKKGQYNVGETANVLIASPFPETVKAVITVERAGIMSTETVDITSNYTYQLPITAVHAPNVYVSVMIARGSGKGTDDGLIVPEVRFGTVNISVSVQQQLKIKVTPSVTQAKPGDTVSFDVLVTDLQDRPVAAEVGLSLSDLANLSVGGPNSAPIFQNYWGERGLAVIASSSLTRLIDTLQFKDISLQVMFYAARAAGSMTALPTASPANSVVPAPAQPIAEKSADGVADAAKGADRRDEQLAQAAATPRTNFVDTPMWVPDLVTGADGHATATVTLPDNLTTWRLDVRGIDKNTFVGDATLDIMSSKPLLVRPATPRFFVVGDEVELAMVVNNNADRDLDVDVKLDVQGVTLRADAKQTVKIPKSGRVRVTWLAKVDAATDADLTFTAVSADGQFSDSSKPAVGIGDKRLLPIYRYEAPDYVATAGVLREGGQRTEGVKLPSLEMAPTGELTVKLNPSLAATTLDALTYLRNYPYQCIEQTVSRFLPNIITYRALQKLNLAKPELRANLESAVSYALARLAGEQKPDGGWGWYPLDESNPLTTSYALWALIEARDADFKVDPDMINRATAYLMGQIAPVSNQTPLYQLNRTAFVLFVMARAGSPNTAIMDNLFQWREKISYYARALLAQAYDMAKNAAGAQDKITTLVSDLQTAAIASGTGIHWEESQRDWWNWGSDTRTTAIVLQTLIRFQPKSDLIPNVVRWLMVARRGDVWETTQETAWAIMALTNWMDVSGELKANYTYTVGLNGKQVGDGKGNADTLRDTNTLVLSVADMLRDQVNKVTIDRTAGDGALYYTATLHVNQPVEAIKPTNRGMEFNRTYYVGDKPVTSVKVGDVVTVVLEFTLSSDMYYVVINDPIPAGTEALDRSLKTTTQAGQQPELSQINPYDGWGWWWFSSTELRTEKVVLSAQYLPRGSYRYVYQVQATTPGTYRVIPANGNEFYFPEVFGRGAGTLFTVTGE